MRRSLPLAAGLLACMSAFPALADYPDKAVTLVVPFSAGGPTDKVARDLAEAMRKPLGGTIVIENVGGAGGTLGANKVAKANADGYTLLIHHAGIATAPSLYRSLPYKTLDDFEYLGMVNEVPMTLIGRANLPANTHAELLKWLAALLRNKASRTWTSRSRALVLAASPRCVPWLRRAFASRRFPM